MTEDKLKDAPDQDREPEADKPDDTPRQDKPSRFARFVGHAGKGMTTEELMELTRGE